MQAKNSVFSWAWRQVVRTWSWAMAPHPAPATRPTRSPESELIFIRFYRRPRSVGGWYLAILSYDEFELPHRNFELIGIDYRPGVGLTLRLMGEA